MRNFSIVPSKRIDFCLIPPIPLEDIAMICLLSTEIYAFQAIGEIKQNVKSDIPVGIHPTCLLLDNALEEPIAISVLLEFVWPKSHLEPIALRKRNVDLSTQTLFLPTIGVASMENALLHTEMPMIIAQTKLNAKAA